MNAPRAATSARAAIIFRTGRCDAADMPMSPVPGDDRHASRCLKWQEIDWDAPAEGAR